MYQANITHHNFLNNLNVPALSPHLSSIRSHHYFKYCKISALALLKMVMHARSGGNLEVMGLMLGKVDGETMIIMDSFALPVEGTETRVNAQAAAYEYMAAYIENAKQVRHWLQLKGITQISWLRKEESNSVCTLINWHHFYIWCISFCWWLEPCFYFKTWVNFNCCRKHSFKVCNVDYTYAFTWFLKPIPWCDWFKQ